MNPTRFWIQQPGRGCWSLMEGLHPIRAGNSGWDLSLREVMVPYTPAPPIGLGRHSPYANTFPRPATTRCIGRPQDLEAILWWLREASLLDRLSRPAAGSFVTARSARSPSPNGK